MTGVVLEDQSLIAETKSSKLLWRPRLRRRVWSEERLKHSRMSYAELDVAYGVPLAASLRACSWASPHAHLSTLSNFGLHLPGMSWFIVRTGALSPSKNRIACKQDWLMPIQPPRRASFEASVQILIQLLNPCTIAKTNVWIQAST